MVGANSRLGAYSYKYASYINLILLDFFFHVLLDLIIGLERVEDYIQF